MSISDCIKCWTTPCTCGFKYKNWPEYKLRNHIFMLEKVLEEKIENERPKKECIMCGIKGCGGGCYKD